MVEQLLTLENARKISASLPIAPKRIIVAKYIVDYERVISGLKGVGLAQLKSDEALSQGQILRVEPGIKAEVVYWDGAIGQAACFNPAGVMIGFGQLIWNQDPARRERQSRFMNYTPSYTVASGFEGQGYATTTMHLLENFAAANNTGIGAGFFYDVQAETPEKRKAANALITRVGAVPVGNGISHMRFLIKPEYYRYSKPGIVRLKSTDIVTAVKY